MIPMDTFIMNDLTILKKEEIRKLQEKYKQEKEFQTLKYSTSEIPF